MVKAKSAYVCQNCGSNSPKWVGRCPSCNEWNTYEEILIEKRSSTTFTQGLERSKPILLQSVSNSNFERTRTLNHEFDRVLGGGIVKGSVILLGGEPGIGKSTLLLQIAQNLSNKILYVSGEESNNQIKLRSDRLKNSNSSVYLLSEVLTENIIDNAKHLDPELLIVDSIQTLRVSYIESSAGTITQIRESATKLLEFAKEKSIPIILVGHITKDGNLAGPKILEHIVDVVLQFEGDNNFNYRILRAHKNRFGSTSEIGIFEMSNTGLIEVENPSEILQSKHNEIYSGISSCATVEGIRPLMIEVQALVSNAVYSTPQRSTTGFDNKRLNMLLAVLEKKIGFKLSTKDVFLNIAGGIKVKDTAIDLAVICAILSSDVDKPIPFGTCFTGEVGLSGEIRQAQRIDQRISEAEKLGFKRIFIPGQKKHTLLKSGIEIIEVNKVEQVFQKLFEN